MKTASSPVGVCISQYVTNISQQKQVGSCQSQDG